MDSTKDYYAILGILPSAEAVVIRAAFKALAQRYHPDVFEGDKAEAGKRMADLNEAYGVLSDSGKRAEYDKLRGRGAQRADSFFSESDHAPPKNDPLATDWKTAVSFYPDLEQLDSRLAKYSWRLAYSFRATLLQEKTFEKRIGVAKTLEAQFFESYFGDNKTIQSFARTLIEQNQRAAARALNNAVRVLGGSADADRIISRIRNDFGINDESEVQKARSPKAGSAYAKSTPRIRELVGEMEKGLVNHASAGAELVTLLGGTVNKPGPGAFTQSYDTVLDGVSKHHSSEGAFVRWVRSILMPRAKGF